MRITAFFLGMFLLSASDCSAKVRVLDGDSLIVDGSEIRLIGIDAPEHRQMCYDEDENSYDCGEESKKFLKELVQNRKVSCRKIKKDIYRRNLSECFADDININVEMLRLGRAITYYQILDGYAEAQREAQEKGSGMWRGRFMKPEFFRLLHKE